MKRLSWAILIVVLGIFLVPFLARAQTVYTKQTEILGASMSAAAFSVLNPIPIPLTDCIRTTSSRSVCFDLSLVDANSSITSIDMTCQTVNTWANCIARTDTFRLPIFVSTSASGVTTSVPMTLHQTSTTGGAPGTSNWAWCITNIPGPLLYCNILANGVITAAVDTIAVAARTVTP